MSLPAQPPRSRDATPSHQVRVRGAASWPAGAFEARPDEPLLLAALRAGLDWPWSCRNGSCRSCRTRVLAGASRHLIEWPGLSAEEKAEGWILPCVAVALGDLTLAPPPEATA